MKVKSVFWIIAILAVVCVLFVYSIRLPSVQKFIVKRVEQRCGCNIDVEGLSLNMFGKQTAENIKIQSGDVSIDLQKIKIYSHLYQLLFYGSDIVGLLEKNNVLLESGNVTIGNKPFIELLRIEPDRKNHRTMLSCQLDVLDDRVSSIVHFEQLADRNFVHMKLRGKRLTADAKGEIIDETIRLIDSAQAKMTLTEKGFNEIFSGSQIAPMYAQNVTISIEPEGTYIPTNLDYKNLHLPKIVVDLGKVEVKIAGLVFDILDVIRLNFSTNKRTELWFQDVIVAVTGGEIGFGRCEVLVDRQYELCTWGLLNFIRKNLDMHVGITAQCLNAALGISGLPESYVIGIHLDGTIDNPHLHKSKSLQDVAKLLLISQNPLVSPASVVPGSRDVPPARKPFPWSR